jgi:UDP-N-acetylmuramate dehydrogenase
VSPVVRQSAAHYSRWIRLEGVTIQENVPLAQYTTLGVGGPARWFARVTSQHQLLDAVAFARPRRLPIFVLGAGSNLLVSDKGFPGLVIHAFFGNHVIVHPHLQSFDSQPNPTTLTVSVDAGTIWDDFVLSICKQGISGVECLAGIPGLVGGGPIQNIGAYGQEIANTIHTVTALDLDSLNYVELDREACRFAYRSSLFNTTHRNRYIVTCVTFQFDLAAKPNLTYADLTRHFAATDAPPSPLEIYHAVRAIRARKGMLLVEGDPDAHSAGSFFKNPVVQDTALARIAATLDIAHTEIPNWPAGEGRVKLPAAWLVERAGFHKGFRMGRAGISTKHTLALVNLGGATASEIISLRDAVIHKVEERFALRLEQEPVLLGFTPPG